MSEETPYKYVAWPAWRYDLKTGEGKVFDSEAEVPKGWTEKAPPPVSEGAAAQAQLPSEDRAPSEGNVETSGVDAAGVSFDAARHTGTKTKAGLWRMKVGVPRPEAEGKILDL